MIIDKLESLLNVRPSEWKEIGFFWTFTFLCWFSLAMGDSVADAIFVMRVGAGNLPLMFILCSVAAIPVSVILTYMQGRVEKRRLASITGFIFAIVILAVVRFFSGTQTASVRGCYLLYFITNLQLFVIPVIISVLIGTQFNSLKAKRLVPLILTGVIAGRIAAGLTLSHLAASYPISTVLWCWLIIHACAFVFFFFGSSGFVKPPIQAFFSRHHDRKMLRPLEKLRLFLRSLSHSRLVLFLVLSAICANFLYYFAEFQGAAIFSSHFASENDLARFYGYFTIFSSILAFLFQGMITGNLVQRLGISATNLIYPSLVLVGFSATAVSFSLLPGIVLKFIQVGLLNAMFQPVNNLFYNALPPKEKARIITVNEGILQPLGTVFTGLLLAGFGLNNHLLMLVPVIAAAFWVILAVMMRRPYRESLLKLLRSSSLDFFGKADLQKLNLDRNTLSLLLNHLDASDEETSALIVQLIVNNGDRNGREQLVARIGHFDNDKKIEILRHVDLPVDHFTGELLFQCLQENNEELQRLALKSLTRFPASAKLRQKVLPFLGGENEVHRRLAAVLLVRIGDLDQMMQSLKIIHHYFAVGSDIELMKGIEVIGYTADERFWVNLKAYLRSSDIRIRHAAVAALERIVSSGDSDEHYEIIGRLIKDDSREIRYLALKILSRLSEPRWFYHVVEGLSDSSPRNRKLAQEILIAHYDDKFSELIMVLESTDASLHAKAAVASILAASQDPGVREYLHQFGHKMMQQL
jgi:HEAT repeat protein